MIVFLVAALQPGVVLGLRDLMVLLGTPAVLERLGAHAAALGQETAPPGGWKNPVFHLVCRAEAARRSLGEGGHLWGGWASGYSLRRAVLGSTPSARRAGT